MKKNSFTFQQFEIKQEHCGMKVGTDGVLLGAWALGGDHVLDIGTGTGLLALMMAQRYPNAFVDAIDIDDAACRQAVENVRNSIFHDQICVHFMDLQKYYLFLQGNSGDVKKYDSIISNPPYFVNSLKNPDSQRMMARHAESLPYSELLEVSKNLLKVDGSLSVILPAETVDSFVSIACSKGYYLSRKHAIKTVSRKQPSRYLLELKLMFSGTIDEQVFCLMNSDGKRTDWFANMTSDFYLY